MANEYSDLVLNDTALNGTAMPYNTTQDFTAIQDLFVASNTFMDGGLAMGIIFSLWAISFYSFSRFNSFDSLQASTWVAFLTSALLSLLDIISSSFSFLFLTLVLAITAYKMTGPPRR